MTLLLMAAGRGSRYGKLKQFDQLGPNDEFIMEFSLFDAISNGFNHIVVVTQKSNISFLENYLRPKLDTSIRLDVVSQDLADLPKGIKLKTKREKPLGTAHAVWSARNVINNPFAVINTDDYYGKKAFKSASEFMKSNNDFGVIAYKLSETLSDYGTVSRGICTGNENLETISERTKIEKTNKGIVDTDTGIKLQEDDLVSMNFWICKPSIFKEIEEDIIEFSKKENTEKEEIYLPYVIKKMIEQNKATVKIIPSNSKWFGVTYADDKQNAISNLKEMTINNDYNNPLWS